MELGLAVQILLELQTKFNFFFGRGEKIWNHVIQLLKLIIVVSIEILQQFY